MKLILVALIVIFLALWVFSSSRAQQSLPSKEATVQAQMTAVLRPPTPTK